MMIEATLSETARMLGVAPPASDVRFRGVSTDTRSLASGALFVALTGERFDGHDYLGQAAHRGAAAALVSRASNDLPTVQVTDTRQALGRLAAAWRRRFHLPVIGVTGSNGKTTVKEMLAAICREGGPTLATRGNFNNEIGLPLTLLELDASHRHAVIEMGASAAGEIACLAGIARPQIGVITNSAAAHLEGFGSLEGVIRAKGELYASLPKTGIAVINNDDNGASVWHELAGERRVVTFGLSAGSHVMPEVGSVRLELNGGAFSTRFAMRTPEGALEISLALAGRHNVMNALAASAAALAAGMEPGHIVAGLEKVKPVAGRLQLRVGQQGARVIDDTYNANPHSLRAAMEVLRDCPGERWLVLGDMAELGENAEELHAEVGAQARRLGIERLFTLGDLSRQAARAFGSGALHSQHHQALVGSLLHALHSDTTLLVKGSRSMRMEQVVEALVLESDRAECHGEGGR
ncbi:MAG: UDP-N-acetylmuramoyl-tripeptide--D-alanyl-D-alanine ligase [Gammaproteobacteria bacterium]